MCGLTSKPKFRSAASQLCGAFPYYCLKFAFGTTAGFQIILIAELYKKDSEIATTVDQLSWFAGLDILSPLGSIITGLAMHHLGSRATALAETALFVGPWLLYHYSSSASFILAARAFTALAGTTTLASPHVSEISEPHLRGPFLVICQMSNVLGSFFSRLLGTLVHWRTIALVNLTFPILAAVTVLATPNSPTWLANKGRLDEAEEALCWLRGWVHPNRVQSEFRALAEHAHRSKSSLADVESANWRERSRRFWGLFHRRSFYAPLATMCAIYCAHQLSGVHVVNGYSTVIFQRMNSPIDASIASAIVGAASIVGNVVALLLVRHAGKRKLALFSVVVAGSCYATIAVVGVSKLQGDYSWLPPIAVILALFADFVGSSTIVYMLNSEIFPASVRYVGASISLSFSIVLSALLSKVFFYAVEAITLPGIFFGFAAMNFVAIPTYYFLMPETEGRSLREIEDHYAGVKRLDQRDN